MPFQRSPALVALLLAAAACARERGAPAKPAVDSVAYVADTKEWRAKRLDAIAGPDGWSTLAGLFWLDSTRYSVGSSAVSTIRLPGEHVPARLGTLTVVDKAVLFTAATAASVYRDSIRVDTATILADKSGTPTVLSAGSVTLRVIERAGRLALRVKDSSYVLRRDFVGLDYFPLDTAQRVQARLVPHDSPRTLRIVNVIGQTEEYPSPGVLEFTLHGKPLRVTAAYEGKDTTQYFLIFRDSTSRDATYPAGRFMYAAHTDSTGTTILDFNRAFNPPCAFTPFATCPLPPAENMIPHAITAGEKRYRGPHGDGAELKR